MNNYESLVERISKSSGNAKEDIERKIDAKRAKLSGLISKEGAAQIVAAELGIVFENERLKISELVQGMKKAIVIGKIIQIFSVRDFNKNGREGKIGSFLLADEGSNIRTVLWDTNHISLIEKGEIAEGDVVEITNGSIRNGELHLSAFSDIKKSKEKMGEVVQERALSQIKLENIKPGMNAQIRAFIVQVFEPRYFNPKSNPNEKKALLNLVLDDGTGTIRGTAFAEKINSLGLNDEEIFSLEKFETKKSSILGEEKTFSGVFRNNDFTNSIELSISEIKDIEANDLIKELEAKA